MAPQWRPSADKHRISRADAVHAMLYATYRDVLADEPREEGHITLFIGAPHSQALPDDEIEILVHEYPNHPGREAEIFHVDHLSPKFRRYREEHPKS